MEVIGVFSSWETLATKSRLTCSSLLSRLISFRTIRVRVVGPSSPLSLTPWTWTNRFLSLPTSSISLSITSSDFIVFLRRSVSLELLTSSVNGLPNSISRSMPRSLAAASLKVIIRPSSSMATTPSTILVRMASRSFRCLRIVMMRASSWLAISLRVSASEPVSSRFGIESFLFKSPAANRSAPRFIASSGRTILWETR